MQDKITLAIDALASAAFIEGGVSPENTQAARELTEQRKRELVTAICTPCLAQISEPAAVAGPAPIGWRLVPAEPTSKQICLMTGAILGQPKGMADNRDPRWLTAAKAAEAAYQAAFDYAPAAPALEAPAAPAGEVVYRWQALDFSGYCYGSNPPEDLPARCNLTPFYRQPDAYRAALHEISATGNLTATDQQFARHLQQIARDALEAAPQVPAPAQAEPVSDEPPFLQRLRVEQRELQERYEKLEAFLTTLAFSMLDNDDADLLVKQSIQQHSLLQTLNQRIHSATEKHLRSKNHE